jgi:hypothetical protein
MGKTWAHIFIATCLGSAVALAEEDTVAPPPAEIVISVAEQKLALLKDGGVVRKYPISTSKFGLGDSYNSYRTPLGHLRVCEKIGDGLSLGAVLKSRNATGEILPVNAPGRDPIVTRILWLDGLESCNAAAKSRGIYIHGTVEENKLGQPVSYGCIRMRSRDVVELFDETPVGTPVEIVADRFPRFRKGAPKPEILLASNDGMTTKVGPHGLIMVKTANGKATRMLFADSKAAPVTETDSEKTPAPADKSLAKSTPPAPPLESGPRVVVTPPPPAEPRVMLAMSGSFLDADLRKPAAKPAVNAQPPVAEQVAVFRNVVLQMQQVAELFPSDETSEERPLDVLSAHLLNPPTPQFRLAFRTTASAPDL